MDETAVRTSRSRVHVGDPILTRGRYATCDTRGDSRVERRVLAHKGEIRSYILERHAAR